MGAICTSQANERFHEERRHPNVEKSPRTSLHETPISLAHNVTVNDVMLHQIRNAPDDPNLIIINDLTLSNPALQNNGHLPVLLNYNQSNTSLSPMMSPTRPLSNDSIVDHTLQLWCNDIDDIYLPPQQTITIGDEIELIPKYNCLHGVVRFIGEIANTEGIFYGIEFNKPTGSDDVFHFRKLCNGINGFNVNQNSGRIGGISYFTTNAHEALFVRKTQIARILKVKYDIPRLGIHSQIYLPRYKSMGVVKYIGKPQFESDAHVQLIYYGIELETCIQDTTTTGIHINGASFHGHSYWSGCKPGHGVYLDCTELSHLMVPSRYNLLLHGFLECAGVNIPSGIIQLISGYHNKMDIRLTSVPLRIGDRIGCDNVICKKYEPFDIDNNICGPAITVRYTGCNTHNTDFATAIAGYYQFAKTCTIDSGDYNTPWVHKTELQIMQLKDGERERIYRAIDCDNEIPLMLDCKSIRSRFRHDIHMQDVDECNHTQILEHIAQLYGATSTEIRNEFDKYGIELYGLRY